MWQYLINHVDDILKSYNDLLDPEWVLADEKYGFIMRTYEDSHICRNCYACQECLGICKSCPIITKTGDCIYDENSAFQLVLKAIVNGDRELFIREAGRIRDAWE